MSKFIFGVVVVLSLCVIGVDGSEQRLGRQVREIPASSNAPTSSSWRSKVDSIRFELPRSRDEVKPQENRRTACCHGS